jgi:hypothetical protein
MQLGQVKRRLQDHLADGLVVIVGSGLSCGEGLPGMGALARHLLDHIPRETSTFPPAEWEPIAQNLDDGVDLETALHRNPPGDRLEAAIVSLSAELILASELDVVEKVLSGQRTLRFSRLLPHLLKPETGVPVVTTNYDRLLEIACESVGLCVDTMFLGTHCAHLNPEESRFSFCRKAILKGKSVRLKYAKRANIYKPHGSLDWYLRGDHPLRCPLSLSLPRLIIPPGLNKFRSGYEQPFDKHREHANVAIDRGCRYLIIGYGFNDDHLETHLTTQIRQGKPAVILTRGLSSNAKVFVKENASVLGVVANGAAGTTILDHTGTIAELDQNIWDLGSFVEEVLEP